MIVAWANQGGALCDCKLLLVCRLGKNGYPAYLGPADGQVKMGTANGKGDGRGLLEPPNTFDRTHPSLYFTMS